MVASHPGPTPATTPAMARAAALAAGQPIPPALLWLGALYLLVMFGRFCDYFLVGLKLPLVFTVLSGVIVLFANGIRNSVRTPAGWAVWGLIFWLPVTIPLSFWRSQSLGTYKTFLIHVLIFFVLAGLPRRLSDVRIFYRALCLSGLLLLGVSAAKGVYADGRLFLPGGMFTNANDLAMVILISACLWCYFLLSDSVPMVFKFVVFGVLGVHFVLMLRTGSRGAIFGIAMAMLYAVWKLRGIAKLKLLTGIGVLAIGSIAFLPSVILDRFATIGDAVSQDHGARTEASESAASRWVFMKDSIRYTIANPVFGIGPGTFSAYWGNEKLSMGREVRFNVNHNSYLQASSETGFPGLFLYLAVHWLTFRNVGFALDLARRSRFPAWRTVEAMSIATGAAMAAYATTSFFLTLAYLMPVYLLAGISAAIRVGAEYAAATMPVPAASGAPVATVPQTAERKLPEPSEPRRNSRLQRGLRERAGF